MQQSDFSENFIKGRIAETVFELMFREVGKFTIIPLGYEHITPQLAQISHLCDQVKKVIDNIRLLPDFILFSSDTKEVFMIEVKYRKRKDDNEIKEAAQKLLNNWDPVFLFVATHEAFYFDSCNNILYHHPQIAPLESIMIPHEIQDKYILLLQEFEK